MAEPGATTERERCSVDLADALSRLFSLAGISYDGTRHNNDWLVVSSIDDVREILQDFYDERRRLVAVPPPPAPKISRWTAFAIVVCMWLDRFVLRLTWKREIARAKWKIWRLEDDLREARNEERVYRECYVANMDELTRAQALVRTLRHRISQVGRESARQHRPRLPA